MYLLKTSLTTFKFLLLLTILFLWSGKDSFKNVQDKDVWFKNIQSQIKHKEYEFNKSEKVEFNYQATNRQKGIRFFFKDNFFEIHPRVLKEKTDWKISYKVQSLQRDNKNLIISNLKNETEKNNLFYSNDWFKISFNNSPKGLRQDFSIDKKLEGNGPLKLILDYESSFDVVIKSNLIEHQKNKKMIASYQDLKVTDADGKVLNAYFEKLSTKQFAIVVKDDSAKYPILIDPLTTTASWNTEQNQADAYFGYSMAYVGDTNGDGYGDVLVGAPNFDNGQTDEGKVFLYFGNATGLATTASWSYENNIAGSQVGYAVDGGGKINSDTYYDIIVGAPYYTSGQTEEGAVYVFNGSASGPATTPSKTIQSNKAGAHFGMSVTGGAKFNNDAYADMAIGAPHYQTTYANQGAIFVYHGAASGMGTTATVTLVGVDSNAQFGQTLKAFGDVDNDGYTDLAISAPGAVSTYSDEGAVYLYKGSSTGIVTTPAWTHFGGKASMYYGETMAGGDINKDGKADLIVGAPRAGTTYNSSGEVQIFYSNGTTFGTSPNVTLQGNADWDYFGGGLACADLNGDGHSELVVGSTLYTGTLTNEGKVTIYYGTSFGLNTTPAWVKVGGMSEGYFGQAIAVGDVNGDGVGDLMISAPYETNGQTYEGKIYSYYGSPRGLSPAASLKFNVTQASSQFAFAMDSAGDVNGDGYDDVIIGAYNYDNTLTNEGAAFLFLGGAGGLSTTPSWTKYGAQASAQFGYSVAGKCDVNHDGYGDVLIGANLYDNGQTNEGKVFVFYGSGSGLPATASWTNESNLASGQFGKSVSCSGDTNGDGYDDILIGAPNFKNTLTNEGKVYLYRGSSTGLLASPSWTFIGAKASALAGGAVAKAGDINGDGYSDILIGAPRYTSSFTSEGAVFLFYGSATGPGVTPNWTKYGGVASAQLGYSLSYAGKLNNDNYADFIIGAPYYVNTLTGEGAAFIYYGSASGPQSTPIVSFGGQANANFGKVVASAGDSDGDGYNEVIATAPLYDNGQTNEGAGYIFQGTSSGITTATVWKFECNLASASCGTSVAGDLDINGDGYSDLVLGASTYKITNTSDGAAFVFYGNPP